MTGYESLWRVTKTPQAGNNSQKGSKPRSESWPNLQNNPQHPAKRRGSEKSAKPYTTFKFLRACDNCRLRKIKCVMKQSKCDHCRLHSLECSFENRIKDGIEVPKKKKLIEDIPLNHETVVPSLPTPMSYTNVLSIRGSEMQTDVPPNIPTNMRQLLDITPSDKLPYPQELGELPKTESSPTDTNLNSEHSSDFSYIVLLYKRHVEPYTPYVHVDSIYEEQDPFSSCCIKLAASCSLNSCSDSFDTPGLISELNASFHGLSEWTIGRLSCFFLLPTLIPISVEIITGALDRFLELYNANSEIPINLAIGALSVDAWNSLLTPSKLQLPSHMFSYYEEFLRFADDAVLHYHLAELNFHLSRFLSLTEDQPLDYNSTRRELLQLEYDILLLPVKLPKQFLVVKDRLTSSREALFYHVLHNAFLTFVYTKALTSKLYGKMLSVYPIAGLYHFLSGLIESTLEIGVEKAGPWSIVGDCMVHSIKCGLELLDIMDFDDLLFVMSTYKERLDVRNPLLQQQLVRKVYTLREQSSYYRDFDRVDGSLVFWVFRDVRSMTLSAYLRENNF